MTYYLAIDIGGTGIKYAVYSSEGQLLSELKTVATTINPSIIQTLKEIIMKVKSTFQLAGVCVSSAGVVDHNLGKVIYAGNTIPHYSGSEIKKEIEDTFGISCTVENDVNCTALGEFWKGAGKGVSSFVCVTIGTGIGGAIMIADSLVRGVNHSAAEIGYININGSAFQDVASAVGLVKKANQLEGEVLFENGKDVFDAADKGNIASLKAIDYIVTNLATGISTLIYMFNPEKIILSGAMMNQEEYLYQPLQKKVEELMVDPFFMSTELTVATYPETANLLGALYNFKQKKLLI